MSWGPKNLQRNDQTLSNPTEHTLISQAFTLQAVFAHAFYTTHSNEYSGVALKKGFDDWNMITLYTAKSVFKSLSKCLLHRQWKKENRAPCTHESRAFGGTVWTPVTQEGEHSCNQEYSTEHNKDQSFHFR